MAKKKNELTKKIGLILLTIVVIVFIWGVANDKFNITFNIPSFGTDFNVDVNLNDALESPNIITNTCSLDFSDNTVCVNEEFTATLKDGKNTHCYIFANDGSSWEAVYEGYTDDFGIWSEEKQISATGNWVLRGFCDKDDDKMFSAVDCITNNENLNVELCGTTNNNGDLVGGESGSTTFEGDETEIEIDLSGLEDGNCDLKALISYQWDYVDADKCFGLQAMEGIKFSLYDSDSLEWQKIHYTPIGLGSETRCGLNWDGTNNWIFKAEKIYGVDTCEIALDYDVKVVTCNCE